MNFSIQFEKNGDVAIINDRKYVLETSIKKEPVQIISAGKEVLSLKEASEMLGILTPHLVGKIFRYLNEEANMKVARMYGNRWRVDAKKLAEYMNDGTIEGVIHVLKKEGRWL